MSTPKKAPANATIPMRGVEASSLKDCTIGRIYQGQMPNELLHARAKKKRGPYKG